ATEAITAAGPMARRRAFARTLGARAAFATTSGPIPAGSPSVTPTRGRRSLLSTCSLILPLRSILAWSAAQATVALTQKQMNPLRFQMNSFYEVWDGDW